MPLLCLKVDGSPRPNCQVDRTGGSDDIPGMSTDKFYGNDQHWHSASARTGSDATRGGWAFWAHGNVRDDTRLWVRIDDQPANCWD